MAGFVIDAPAYSPATGGFFVDQDAPEPKRVADIGDAIINGLQSSATGLAVRGKLPSQQLAEDAPWYHRIASGAAGVIADLPLSVVAAIPAAPTGPVGMAAAAFAAPMGLRDALMEAYGNSAALSWSDAWQNVAKAGLKGTVKGAVIGAATAGAGRVVGAAMPGTALAKGAAATGAELTTMTTTAAALEGHLPSAQDFIDNAILLGGMKTAVHVAKGMRNIYSETGKLPSEVLADAKADPALKATLEAKPNEIPPQYQNLALAERIKNAVDADPRPETIREVLSGSKNPVDFGKPLKTGDPVKYEYITNSDVLRGALPAIEKLYENEIAKQTRGVVTDKAAAADALRRVASGDIVDHVVGMAENKAQIFARAHVLEGFARRMMETMRKFAEKTDAELTPLDRLEQLAAIEQYSMALADFRGARAEAGRALQAFSALKRDPSLMGEAEGVLAIYQKKGSLAELNALVRNMKDPTQLAKFTEGYMKATTPQKVIEAWRAAIFSGPMTWQANILGNVAKWVVDVPESVISASLTALDRKAKGDPLSMAQWKARAFAPFYGAQLAALDGMHLVAEAKKVLEAKGLAEGSKELAAKASDTLARSDDRIDVYKRANEGAVGKGVGFSFGMLKAQDLPFRTVGERAEAHILAVDRATKEGWHPNSTEWREAVAKYRNEPTLELEPAAAEKILAKIENAGAESVFGQRLGPKAERMSGAISGTPWEFLFPARRTPANLLSWSAQHIPGLNFMSARWRADWAAGGEAQAKAAARIVVGTAIAATAYQMALDGTLTGGSLADKEGYKTRAGAGEQGYSLKVGDKFYSIQRIEPVAKILMLTADLVEIMNSPKILPEEKGKAAAMLTLAFANATISTTYLSGLSNTFRAALDPERYGETWMEGYATSVVPKILSQPVVMADPYKREVDGVIDAIQSQLPLLREKLIASRNSWGEKQTNERLFSVMPIATTEASKELVHTEALRLGIAIADAPKYVEERGPFDARDKRVKLDQEQRDIFREVAGKNAMAILAPIVNDPDWKGIPDFAKAAIYRDVLEGTRSQGRYAALPPDAESRQKVREKIIDKIRGQTEDAAAGRTSVERRVK